MVGFGLYLVNLLADAGYELLMQCVNTGLGAETDVIVEWDKYLLCLQCCLPVLVGGVHVPCPLREQAALPVHSGAWGTVGLSPLLDLYQHPEVLLIAGEA